MLTCYVLDLLHTIQLELCLEIVANFTSHRVNNKTPYRMISCLLN